MKNTFDQHRLMGTWVHSLSLVGRSACLLHYALNLASQCCSATPGKPPNGARLSVNRCICGSLKTPRWVMALTVRHGPLNTAPITRAQRRRFAALNSSGQDSSAALLSALMTLQHDYSPWWVLIALAFCGL